MSVISDHSSHDLPVAFPEAHHLHVLVQAALLPERHALEEAVAVSVNVLLVTGESLLDPARPRQLPPPANDGHEEAEDGGEQG